MSRASLCVTSAGLHSSAIDIQKILNKCFRGPQGMSASPFPWPCPKVQKHLPISRDPGRHSSGPEKSQPPQVSVFPVGWVLDISDLSLLPVVPLTAGLMSH